MNAKQRKQTEKLRAAALDGLESKQQAVEKLIAELTVLREEQQWYEKSRTAKADIERNERAVARLEQHQSLEDKANELASDIATMNLERGNLTRDIANFQKRMTAAQERLSKEMEDFKEADARRVEADAELLVRFNLIERANRPAKETIKDVLMMLELDEDPVEIARQVRAKHDILEPKW
jgi:hypothetical protein